jgi:hypothetical protein
MRTVTEDRASSARGSRQSPRVDTVEVAIVAESLCLNAACEGPGRRAAARAAQSVVGRALLEPRRRIALIPDGLLAACALAHRQSSASVGPFAGLVRRHRCPPGTLADVSTDWRRYDGDGLGCVQAGPAANDSGPRAVLRRLAFSASR